MVPICKGNSRVPKGKWLSARAKEGKKDDCWWGGGGSVSAGPVQHLGRIGIDPRCLLGSHHEEHREGTTFPAKRGGLSCGDGSYQGR